MSITQVLLGDQLWHIECGDALEVLRSLPNESVQTVVTSPPYWGLRDYGIVGQLGLESTLAEYVTKMVQVFQEVRRVLRDDGTIWLNFGDSYAGGGRGAVAPLITPGAAGITGLLKPKNLVGIPWRVAFALQEDGWYLRSDIVWFKPNAMPESVSDRPAKAHEYIFLLSKSPHYYYDAEAIKEAAVNGDPNQPLGSIGVMDNPLNGGRRAKGNSKTFRGGGKYTQGRSFDNSSHFERESHGNEPNKLMTRNKRDVWTVSTKPYSEAHFATYPPDLIEPCILAGAPERGIVLDPFSGSGTTGVVALRHGRRHIGIELNPEYVALSKRRIINDAPLLNDPAVQWAATDMRELLGEEGVTDRVQAYVDRQCKGDKLESNSNDKGES